MFRKKVASGQPGGRVFMRDSSGWSGGAPPFPDAPESLFGSRFWIPAHVLIAEELVVPPGYPARRWARATRQGGAARRLVALVPPPRANQVLCGGVLASRHRWHRAVRPCPPRRRRPLPGVASVPQTSSGEIRAGAVELVPDAPCSARWRGRGRTMPRSTGCCAPRLRA